MKLTRGDVVLIDFPFSDRTGSKVRPALVVQDDRWNAALDDAILALISSSRRRRVGAATQRLIPIMSPEAVGTGLRIDSIVQCENLITLEQGLVLSVLGRFGPALMSEIDDCLRAALGIA
ncbi:MAG: type II toxin-antitoxin system PemK/MazF family toxin [Planctomycetaceae bacterium]|nr:type II toxin-antitoxin system PemK/MazF family toxin [Planctomycetaceae bacterium]